MSRFFSFLLVLALGGSVCLAQSQEKAKKVDPEIYSPDIPGSVVVDLGFNWLTDKPDEMRTNWWGSKGVGIFYKYHVMLGKSKFSLRPGIGLGLDRYSFEKKEGLVEGGLSTRYNIGRITDTDNTESIEFVRLDTLSVFSNFFPDIKKSKLVTDYLEIPLEFGWHLSRNDPERGFRVLLGGKVGWLFDSKVKINYQQNGFRKILKLKDGYELNPWRYSATARMGISFIDVFGEVSFSNLFKTNRGPAGTGVTRYWKLGLSFVGF